MSTDRHGSILELAPAITLVTGKRAKLRPWPRHGKEVGDIQSAQVLYRAAVDSEIAHGHSVRWTEGRRFHGPRMSMIVSLEFGSYSSNQFPTTSLSWTLSSGSKGRILVTVLGPVRLR
jgi:hypothetical protein